MGSNRPPTAGAKARLREQLRAARTRRLAEQSEPDGERLAELVCALPEVLAARRVAAYVSRAAEPSTRALLRRWHDAGREILLPVLLPDLDLDWALDAAHRAPGRLPGILEPTGRRLGRDAIASADVVVVPALAVDGQGRRLGQGGGSYDRALARIRADTLVVALLHPGELADVPLPHEPHDHLVHVAVSADGVLRLSSPAAGSAPATTRPAPPRA